MRGAAGGAGGGGEGRYSGEFPEFLTGVCGGGRREAIMSKILGEPKMFFS